MEDTMTSNSTLSMHLATGITVLTVCLVASPQSRAQDLPKADEVMEKYIEATGGRAAHEKRKTSVSTGSFEMPAMGIKGTLKIWQAEPNLMYTEVDIEGMGKTEEGSDGEVAWETSAMMGPRIKTGEERAMAMRAATFDADLLWRELFDKVECVAIENVNDKPCYKVVKTPKIGPPETHYYDRESYLPVKVELTVPTPMGNVPSEQFISDYRKVGDLTLPHAIRQTLMGQEQVIRVEKIEMDVEIPASRFDLPAAIKELIEKDKPAGEKADSVGKDGDATDTADKPADDE
jgi:hypothetical protein